MLHSWLVTAVYNSYCKLFKDGLDKKKLISVHNGMETTQFKINDRLTARENVFLYSCVDLNIRGKVIK